MKSVRAPIYQDHPRSEEERRIYLGAGAYSQKCESTERELHVADWYCSRVEIVRRF